MRVKFTNAKFLYRKTDFNLYNVNPVHVSSMPEANGDSPTIIEYMTNMYEKCVYLDANIKFANFLFTSNGNIIQYPEITASENWISIQRNGLYYSLSADENNTTFERISTIVCSYNGENIPFKVLQSKTNPEIIFNKYNILGYDKTSDIEPSNITNDIIVGNNKFEISFNQLTGVADKKKEEAKIYLDIFIKNDTYLLRGLKKYCLDENYSGDFIAIGSVPEKADSLSPDYIKVNNSIFYKAGDMKNGKAILIYKEGILLDDELYVETSYDNPFKFTYNDDGSLSIINYGRCYLQKKAFYIISISHKFSNYSTGEITIKYND